MPTVIKSQSIFRHEHDIIIGAKQTQYSEHELYLKPDFTKYSCVGLPCSRCIMYKSGLEVEYEGACSMIPSDKIKSMLTKAFSPLTVRNPHATKIQ